MRETLKISENIPIQKNNLKIEEIKALLKPFLEDNILDYEEFIKNKNDEAKLVAFYNKLGKTKFKVALLKFNWTWKEELSSLLTVCWNINTSQNKKKEIKKENAKISKKKKKRI